MLSVIILPVFVNYHYVLLRQHNIETFQFHLSVFPIRSKINSGLHIHHTYISGLSSSFLETRVGHFGSTFHDAPPGHSV